MTTPKPRPGESKADMLLRQAASALKRAQDPNAPSYNPQQRDFPKAQPGPKKPPATSRGDDASLTGRDD